jgi:acetyl/propionyl-CoA carboxylase alpha subunit
MFSRVLVANRGEIALRIFRTCSALGIETVAVVARDDLASLHARHADRTVEIASYLDAAEHIRAARETGVDAVHPGYGFLAESAAFAAAVAEAGLAWVGPPASALRLGGDKLAAKRIAAAEGLPTLAVGEAGDVGYPLLVKSAAGGGGRGMRVVRRPAELASALVAGEREAESAFADGTVFCERYLERPRHVEVQLLADAHGTVVSLGERDCSVQRRHQKVLEEAPAPLLAPAVRDRLAEVAVAFAQAIGYENAGTVEFLVDGNEVFLLELNGRIQVEHPVTEAVTGLDLVAWQLRIAAGERLALNGCRPAGHAVEARIYAEDPHTFLPQSGRLDRLVLPRGVRVDAGAAEGDEVGTRYDPLLAKLIGHGATRQQALDALEDALDETEIGGVTTNLPFLRWLLRHPVLRAGSVSTAFLTEYPPLSQTPLRLPAPPWQRAWRLNLPPPPPASAPDADAAAEHAHHGGESIVTAPMPGTVIDVRVSAGKVVRAREPLLVLEAMKMEHPVTAPFEATVRAVHVEPGDPVEAGAPLVELES